ncbi:hypothetical protein F5Y03DRAFT_152392 [Xylaria venustula]|nr:hypothetical protein F5Y03DRAFT_152392 [Xylaria venustula]
MDEDSDNPRPRPRPTRNLPSRQAKIKAPARATRATAAYFTNSSNTQTSASSSSSSSSSSDTDTHAPARNLRPRRKKRKARAIISATKTPAKSRRRELAIDTTSSDAVGNTLLSEASVPIPFHTLPYHVLLIVFGFVSAPIRNPASRIDDYTEAVNTLLSAARTCKYTAEPALAVLYKCPPFHRAYNKSPQASFIQFLQTLALDPSQTLIRYRPKVQILRLDVDALLIRKINGHQLQLKQVLKHLPRLAYLELYHPADDPPYRDLDSHLRWKLSKDDLLDGLGPPLLDGTPSDGDKTETNLLKSWRWNARLVPADLSLDHLPEVHSLPAFRNMRKLAFVNYQLPSTTHFSARARQTQEAQNSDMQAIAQLAISISALPNLQHLVIESSTLASGSLLERLPKTLTHLELVNCWEITSEDLSKFLMSHGKSLTQLTLKHCQSLSLGFLPVLGTSCPNLTHLEVDLSYFRHHESYADNKPEYATLLEEDDVPTWPPSIQSIEIINMRNWTREAAEMFFGSLMKNAGAMPSLRRLEFKVILNIEWRQRQEMRRSLADRMTKVFKRKSTPPKELKSLRQYNELKIQESKQSQVSRSPARRSSRITSQSSTFVTNNGDDLRSGSRESGQAVPVRGSLRLSRSRVGTDDDSSEDELAMGHSTGVRRRKNRIRPEKNAGSQVDEFIHGLCNVVDIQVDNQRPAERQYDMDDFLDTPEESDPDWNSDED